jgi:ribosomal protein L40E
MKTPKAAQKATQVPGGVSQNVPAEFALLKKILAGKGLSEQEIARLVEAGVRTREDFKMIGDVGTLCEVAGIGAEVAQRVISWALGEPVAAKQQVIVQPTDAVLCVHCGARQPKDHKSGDLCGACGKQAEPIMACFWCGATGPGKFCRQCGSEFLPAAELELGILLKRDGVPRSEIPEKLRKMDQSDKDVLWGRARRY